LLLAQKKLGIFKPIKIKVDPEKGLMTDEEKLKCKSNTYSRDRCSDFFLLYVIHK
jgi:hypothetical protein